MNFIYHNKHNIGIMKSYPDKYFDVAVLDPPYGIGESSKNHNSRNTDIKQKNGKISKMPDLKYKQSDWDNKTPSKQYFKEAFRISKDQIIFGVNYFTHLYKFGPGRIFWDKHTGSNDFADGELAYCSFHDSIRQIDYMWSGMMQGSLENGKIMEGNKKLNEERIHPTQKPVQLYRKIYHKYIKDIPNCKVFDGGLGSGSHVIAAHEFGIHEFVACENDKEMFIKSSDRIKNSRIIFENERQLKLI